MKITAPEIDSLEEIDDLIQSLAESLGSTKEKVVSPSRKREIVQVRDTIVFLLREYGEMSYPAIGRLLGGRDHTTIIHAYRKVKEQTSIEEHFQQEVKKLSGFAKFVKERKESVKKEIEAIADEMARLKKLAKRVPVFKEIPERNLKILDLYREGLTLENISREVGVTRERVRQVVKSTVKQIAINESVAQDIIVDSTIMLEEEGKKRQQAIDARKVKNNKKEKKEKRWSRYYTSCQKCGTTSIPHVRKGLCEQCIGQFRGKRREQIIKEHHNQCDVCSKTRAQVAALHGRDLYITKDKKVMCKEWFRRFTGKRLGGYKKYECSRIYPKCKVCKTTKIPHARKGLCEKCSDKITQSMREQIVSEHGSKCDVCGISRERATAIFKNDFCITKNKKVLCRGCFHTRSKWNY